MPAQASMGPEAKLDFGALYFANNIVDHLHTYYKLNAALAAVTRLYTFKVVAQLIT